MKCVILLFVALVGTIGSASAALVYATDFEDFSEGTDQLVGTEGWQGTFEGTESHGIDNGTIADGGQSAYIGFGLPVTSNPDDGLVVSAYRPINLDPVGDGFSLVRFQSTIAIFDSSNSQYDSFFISAYDRSGNFLSGLVFDNTEEFFGIWRYDGEEFYDTGIFFDHEIAYEVQLDIDFGTNRWSADLDGQSLFEDETFSQASLNNGLGDFSFEWELTNAALPGDNWLSFDDVIIQRFVDNNPPEPQDPSPIEITSIAMDQGQIAIRWNAVPDQSYRVQRSANLVDWANIPGTITPADTDGQFTAGASGRTRFFRILQVSVD
ncbi:MAG: hypothetical protein AAF514_03070 [Verrucomicrobiota bacterium]